MYSIITGAWGMDFVGILNLFIYSNCILHPYGSSNYNTKACKHIKEKQHKHKKYVKINLISL
jgi:hypothetical protein